MFAELASETVPWDGTVIYQVDERVAPPDDPDRNLHHLLRGARVGTGAGRAHAGQRRRPRGGGGRLRRLAAGALRPRPPGPRPRRPHGLARAGDPVLAVADRLVALTRPYQDRVRMTLTYPALARARQILWLVTGEDKKGPLSRLLAGDTGIPAGRVEAGASLVMADAAAAGA